MAEENEQQRDETQPEETPEQEPERGGEGGGEQPAASEAPTGPEESGTEEPRAEEVPEPAAEEPAEPGEPTTPRPPGTAPDLPPGAELEPIEIEPERELSAEERARVEAEAEERARREAAVTEEEPEEPSPAPREPAKLESGARYLATGKRKSSIARVILTPGEGKVEINQRPLEDYFPRTQHQVIAKQPLAVSGYEDSVDVRVRVHGGGISGQAGAVRHGIARALTEIDGELRQELKRRGLLTRDARAKERRKAGLKKARKRPQFSKR
jgi:small subunit ribosomal protein S9